MRSIRSFPVLGLLAFAVAAAPLAAQATAPANPPAAGQVGPRHGRGPQGPGARGQGRGLQAAFRGITLSDAQKTQLQQIQERHRTERRAHLEAQRERWQGQRGANARPDSAARVARRAARTEQAQWLRASMERQLTDVRDILTAEQRPTFDRNVAELKQRMQDRQAERRTEGGRGQGRGFGRRGGV